MGGAGGNRVCRRCIGPDGHPRKAGHSCVCFRRRHGQAVPAAMLAAWEQTKNSRPGECPCALCNPEAAAKVRQYNRNRQVVRLSARYQAVIPPAADMPDTCRS